jgi:hypothetical protein
MAKILLYFFLMINNIFMNYIGTINILFSFFCYLYIYFMISQIIIFLIIILAVSIVFLISSTITYYAKGYKQMKTCSNLSSNEEILLEEILLEEALVEG